MSIEIKSRPEARGEERELRKPGLEALVGLCRAHIRYIEAKVKVTSDA